MMHEGDSMVVKDYMCSPAVLYRARIYKDGNQWCCIYGEFPEGVIGFGDTPQKAVDEFHRVWYSG